MNLGTEDRKKVKALGVLGAILALAVIYVLWSRMGGASPEVAANAPSSNVSAPVATPAARTSSRRTAGGKKIPAPPPLDPTLKLALLKSSEATQYTGNGRNIFRAEADIPKPVASAIVQKPQENLPPPGPPPPPPINLKFFGFASKPGEPRRIFLSKGEDVFIAGEGDIVDRRYKIVQIGPSSVTVQDVLTNNTQQIPLTQG